MKATLVRKTEVYIRCAECGDETSYRVSNIDPGTSFGPWYCNNCGAGIRGYVDGSGVIDLEEAEYRRVPTYVLLRLLPQADPTFLVVQGADLVPRPDVSRNETAEGNEEFLDGDEFFYGHGSYPSLILQNTLAVIRGAELAPSDIFQHVATRAVLRPACEHSDESILMETFGEFIKTSAAEPLISSGTHDEN